MRVMKDGSRTVAEGPMRLAEKEVHGLIEDAVTQQQREKKDIEARKNNIIKYQIPESGAGKFEDRQREDRTFIV